METLPHHHNREQHKLCSGLSSRHHPIIVIVINAMAITNGEGETASERDACGLMSIMSVSACECVLKKFERERERESVGVGVC